MSRLRPHCIFLFSIYPHLPCLQFSFEVKDADQWPYDTVAALIPLFPHKTNILLDAPKLRCVKIKEYNNVPILELLALPTEQLTSLEINWSGNPEDLDTKRHVYVDILCQCKALRNLKLTYRSLVRVPVEHTGISSDLIISLPVLKSLEISCDKVTGPGVALLRCLRTPHLEELSLHHGSQDIRDLSMDLAYFRQHCAPALSSLSLHNFWLAVVIFPPDPRPESFLGILPLFPDIQSLWISNSHFNARPLFQALAYVDEPHQVLLPKLTEFGLENCYNSDCSSELTNMVLSRDSASDTGHGLARLQKLTVYVPRRHLKKEKFARISGLSGLNFDLRALSL
ncbi:hypothetical protein BT96DRAFT_471739 [Gymnopus androsaceus JB14]|uniref:F-box domain-containing protein n=1 Tax=Gymnopus androsaceus JB14 TaxID=1447944 RepID=A0A6A4IJU1_9AGAR|nr:hypothetical protein BT96DRAFT_471739 [Gymnopus androsaceus JB14]